MAERIQPDDHRSDRPGRTSVAADRPADPWSRRARWYGLQVPLELRAVRTLIGLLEVEEGDSLLDLGTGTAVVLRELARSPRPPGTVVGVDRSARMLAHAPTLPAGWRLVEGDAGALEFDDASFDRVTASYLLHLLDAEERARIINEAARVLAPGGRLGTVTVAPAGGRISSLLQRPIRALADRSTGVLAGLRPLDPRPELEAAGLRPVGWRHVRAGYPSLCVVARRER